MAGEFALLIIFTVAVIAFLILWYQYQDPSP